MPLVTVIIPVYKSQPTKNEIRSYSQCLKVLWEYPIMLVCPKNLNCNLYESKDSISNKQIIIERFNEDYFSSIQNYSRLLLSSEFYERFKNFEYIAVYQLDSWVFSDELEYWCNQGYDFIGAPLPTSIKDNINKIHMKDFNVSLDPNSPLMNGGFSLRKTNSCIELLLQKNDLIQEYLGKGWYEDVILSIFLQQNSNSKTPAEDIALKFSFESFPSLSFEKNNKQLPMGCHAWFRDDNYIYDNMFWFKHIIPFYYLRICLKNIIYKIAKKNSRRLKRIKKYIRLKITK